MLCGLSDCLSRNINAKQKTASGVQAGLVGGAGCHRGRESKQRRYVRSRGRRAFAKKAPSGGTGGGDG